jgi:hypothetical protein
VLSRARLILGTNPVEQFVVIMDEYRIYRNARQGFSP